MNNLTNMEIEESVDSVDKVHHGVSEASEDELENREKTEDDNNLEVVPAHYNDDVYRDCECNDDELRYQMIKRPVENDLEQHLYNYCDTNLESRYRHVIDENKILPMETTKKQITLKLRKNTPKERQHIKDVMKETFSTYYPEKILTYLTSTTELLFLERMRDMDREFTCVHEGTYYKIKMSTKYQHKRWGKSFSLVTIEVTTSKFA